ncbi:MAG TPA: hypothetical protein DCY13_13645 [Verrucomicrobiales bacterium]|nr:hypothetical protein [Verrucomicrobiales bacterium]
MNQPNSAQLQAIRQALDNGDKLEAIKLYREATGAELKEAKEAVEDMETGHATTDTVATGAKQAAANRSSAVREALFKGHKIDAIKRYREITGLGLRDAKLAVDKLEADLRKTDGERFARSGMSRGCFSVILCSALLAVVATLIWQS